MIETCTKGAEPRPWPVPCSQAPECSARARIVVLLFRRECQAYGEADINRNPRKNFMWKWWGSILFTYVLVHQETSGLGLMMKDVEILRIEKRYQCPNNFNNLLNIVQGKKSPSYQNEESPRSSYVLCSPFPCHCLVPRYTSSFAQLLFLLKSWHRQRELRGAAMYFVYT